MSANVFKLLSELASKDTPQTIYSYKLRSLFRAGALTLSGVLAIYGYSFADVSLFSAKLQYDNAKDEQKSNAWFLIKAYGPISLAILPFTLSLGSLYVLSRVVTHVSYLPQVNGLPMCEITRQSAILGRSIKVVRPISEIARSSNVRIYTGKGKQGIDDKASFAFYLKDNNASLRTPFNKLYILSRTGTVWNSDGRVLSGLFGGDTKGNNVLFDNNSESIKNNIRDSNDSINTVQKNTILQEMLKLNNSNKVKFHSKAKKQSKLVKEIVNSKK